MLREIYHITEKKNIPSIQERWLMTLQQQSDEWSIDLQNHLKRKYTFRSWVTTELVDFYINTLYFRLNQPDESTSWVSYMVEASVEDVVNNWLEFKWFWKYMDSRMKLADFLKRGKGNKLLHPITAQPLWDDDIDSDMIHKSGMIYKPEIIIQRACIDNLVRINLWDRL